MNDKKRKCSGSRCPMQSTIMSVSECQCIDTCPDYTPVADFSGMETAIDINGMEAVIDMAIKQFGIESDADKQKMRILFNAFAGQYISATCFPIGGLKQ